MNPAGDSGAPRSELGDKLRAFEVEPESPEALIALVQAELRQGLSSSCVRALRDIETWSRLPALFQDQVLELCARWIGWPLQEQRSWTCGSQTHRIGTFTEPQTGMLFNLLPGAPQFAPLLISRFPVTLQHWPDERSIGSLAASIPRTQVSLAEARRWLAERGLRLPKAEEWQHAAMAGAETLWPWGESFDSGMVWCSENSAATIADVLRLGPDFATLDEAFAHPCQDHEVEGAWNAFGLIDLFGNTWEMLEDGRLVGGSYRSSPSQLLSEYDFGAEEQRSSTMGIRAVRSLRF